MQFPAHEEQKNSDKNATTNSHGRREDIEKQVADNGLQTQTQIKAANINNTWDYEEILSIIGFGKTQGVLLLISGLLTMNTMASQLSVGIIAISSQCEFGIVISSYIWGCLSDVLGRRTVLLWTTYVNLFLQLVSMFVTNIWFFNFINFIMGISMGGISGALYAYLGEFNTAKYRPIVINYSAMSVSITAIYIPAISWLLLSTDWAFHITDGFVFKPWRLIIFFCLLPGLIGCLILLSYPESPKLLLALGKQTEAVKAVDFIAKFNRGVSLETLLKCSHITITSGELADASQLEIGKGCAVLATIWKTTAPMFHKPHGVNVILAVLSLFGLMFASNGMQIWFPEIVNRSIAGSRPGISSTVCELIDESYRKERLNATIQENHDEMNNICDDSISSKTYIDNIILGVAFLIGFAIQGAILNSLGRKNVLLACLAVSALCGLLLYVVTSTTGVLALFCLYILLPGLAVSIMFGASVDLVPTHLRGKVVSLAFTLGRLGVIVNSNLVAAMLEPYCDGVFGIITGAIIVCAGLVYFLPI
ncbi:hypothetical protein DOY81_007713 [Sarcophaga bullata]|nr:hypothetical protein DOY81_007713 [Sarcophaga bullata]